MNTRFAFIEKWLDKKTKRERFYWFLSGFVFIYFLFFILFLRPVIGEKKDLNQKLFDLKAQTDLLEQKISIVNDTFKTPAFMQMLGEYQMLTSKLNRLQQQIDNINTSYLSVDELSNLTKKIINQPSNNSTLISLNELPIEPWPPIDWKSKINVLNDVPAGYQHILQIEFQNDYIDAFEYIKNLEKMSQHIYWDSLDYKVLQYPKADVVIKFHVLTLQKS